MGHRNRDRDDDPGRRRLGGRSGRCGMRYHDHRAWVQRDGFLDKYNTAVTYLHAKMSHYSHAQNFRRNLCTKRSPPPPPPAGIFPVLYGVAQKECNDFDPLLQRHS